MPIRPRRLEETFSTRGADLTTPWPVDPDDIPIIEDDGVRLKLKFNDKYANTDAPLQVVTTPVNFETTVQDISTMDEEMPLQTWLSGNDPDKIVFKLNSGVYFPTLKSIVKTQMNQGRNVQYNCPKHSSFEGVEEGHPYFALRSIGCPTGGLVKFSTMHALLNSPNRIFLLEPASNPAKLTHTTSHNSLYLRKIPFYADKGLHVSAAHCQEGTNQLIYNVMAIASSNRGGKKRKTAAKRPTKHKTKKKLRR